MFFRLTSKSHLLQRLLWDTQIFVFWASIIVSLHRNTKERIMIKQSTRIFK